MTVDTQQMITALGISKQRLHELARAGKIPRGPRRNQWILEEVQAAVRNNLDTRQSSPSRGEVPAGSVGRRLSDPAPAQHGPEHVKDLNLVRGIQLGRVPEKGTLAHAQLMHEQAKAAKAALEAQRLEGKLVPAREVELAWSSLITAIRNRMLLIADKVAARVAAESSILECRDIVDRAVREALTAASEYQPNA